MRRDLWCIGRRMVRQQVCAFLILVSTCRSMLSWWLIRPKCIRPVWNALKKPEARCGYCLSSVLVRAPPLERSKKVRPGRLWLDRRLVVGETVRCGSVQIGVETKKGSVYQVCVTGSVETLLRRRGHVPLPPYLKHSPLRESERKRSYQSVFAKQVGSSAAPTASLHFTDRLVSRLQKNGVEFAQVTLHVGLGTFAPVTAEQWQNKKLHEESYQISASQAKKINAALDAGRPVIAVGTTALRALESAAVRGPAGYRVKAKKSTTRLFIRSRYKPKIVSGLITNFHVPGSSLLMLVAALNWPGRDNDIV